MQKNNIEEKKKNFIKNFFIFIILIGVTFYILFKDKNLDDIGRALFSVNKVYILIAILCMFGDIFFEALNTKRTLSVLKEKTSIIKCIKYALLNFFFSSITPSSTGGQPMEVYYMHKEKIKVANATLAVLIQLCSFQLVSLIFSLISILFNSQYLNATLIAFFLFGVIMNIIVLFLFLTAIFSKKLSMSLIKIAVKVMTVLKIKNIDEKQEKLKEEVELYNGSAKYIKNNKLVIIKTIITTFFQMVFYFSVSYWVYRSFGLNTYNIMQIITIQSVLYTASAAIPLPGAVGVTEGNFMMIYSSIFPEQMINSAMLLSRGASFYLYVLISGIVVILNRVHYKKRIKEK